MKKAFFTCKYHEQLLEAQIGKKENEKIGKITERRDLNSQAFVLVSWRKNGLVVRGRKERRLQSHING